MLAIESIIRTAVRDHDGETPSNLSSYVSSVKDALERPDEIPWFSKSSRPLSLVRFRCLLQDTGYPAEVYLPVDPKSMNGHSHGGESSRDSFDWGSLKERWVGWAVEIPGEQAWSKNATASSSSIDLGVGDAQLPPVVKDKYPLFVPDYLGALVKVYDDVSYTPSSVHTFIGIVSTAPIPTPFSENEDDSELPLVPAIHVLVPPGPAFPAPISTDAVDVPAIRAALIDHLASAFFPRDVVAAELLVLTLLSWPSSRPIGLPPLGTLSLNLIRRPTPNDRLTELLRGLAPVYVPLPLTLHFLHTERFCPSCSDGASLTPGFMQLAPGSVLAINEDGIGQGGQLADYATVNLRAIIDCIKEQTVRYEYPYMDAIKMDCAIRVLVFSEAKCLLPVDVRLPVTLIEKEDHDNPPPLSEDQLRTFRTYLTQHSTLAHASSIDIPEDVGQAIQDDFVASRQAASDQPGGPEKAEKRLKRQMKIARLLAISYPDAKLTIELWRHAVELDTTIERRFNEHLDMRRLFRMGMPPVEHTPTPVTWVTTPEERQARQQWEEQQAEQARQARPTRPPWET